jgi:hypothetical protein
MGGTPGAPTRERGVACPQSCGQAADNPRTSDQRLEIWAGASEKGETQMSGRPVDENDGLPTYEDPEERAVIEAEKRAEKQPGSTAAEEKAPLEPNVLCSLFVCVAGVAFDALYQLPGELLDDVPATMRTTSIVLCVILGAPPVTKTHAFILEQRAVVGILLATSAFVGLNRGEVVARNSDAVFAVVATLACAVACASNGVSTQEETKVKKRVVREHLSAFVAALLFYLGMRTIRHAYALPAEVQGFTVRHGDINARGYAIASEVTTCANAFSGAITVSFAILVLLNFDMVLGAGSNSMSTVAGTLASLVFASAFVAQLHMFSLFHKLPALFGSNACDGSIDDCAAAFRARRFFSASNTPALPFVCAISMTTFAFSARKRFESRRHHFQYTPDLYTTPVLSMLFASTVAAGTILFFVDAEYGMNWSEIELMFLVLSVPAALLHFPITSLLLHLSGQIVYIYTRFAGPGYSLVFFTHHSLFASAVLSALLVLTSTASYALYSFRDYRLYSDPVETVTAVLATGLLSVQTFLTLSTIGMTSGYEGAKYDDGKGSFMITGYKLCICAHT